MVGIVLFSPQVADGEGTVQFDGDSYAMVSRPIRWNPNISTVMFKFRTFSSNALLMYLATDDLVRTASEPVCSLQLSGHFCSHWIHQIMKTIGNLRYPTILVMVLHCWPAEDCYSVEVDCLMFTDGDHYVGLGRIPAFLNLLINFPLFLYVCEHSQLVLSIRSLKYHTVMAGRIWEEMSLI